MTTDVHNLGNYSSLAEVWGKYPSGGNTGDYVFINGVRYNWDKYERQWLTPVAITDMNIRVFDISTYDFTVDWRVSLPDGEYSVVSNTRVIGKLVKYGEDFNLTGFLTLMEKAQGDADYTAVVHGNPKKADSKVVVNNDDFYQYVYVDIDRKYRVDSKRIPEDIASIKESLSLLNKDIADLSDGIEAINESLSSLDKDITDLSDEVEAITPKSYSLQEIDSLTEDSTAEEIAAAFTPTGQESPAVPRVGDLLKYFAPSVGTVPVVNVTMRKGNPATYSITYLRSTVLHTVTIKGFLEVTDSVSVDMDTSVSLNTSII